MVQHNENANPPTFFLTLDVMLQLMTKDDNVIRCEGGRKEGKRGRGGGWGVGGVERGGGGGGGGEEGRDGGRRKGNVNVVKHGKGLECELGLGQDRVK